MNYLEQLAEFACETRLDVVPPQALAHLRVIVADTVAACAAGNQEAEMQAMGARQSELCGAGEAQVIGTRWRLNPVDAAALNACAGCWLELDEGNLESNGHPGIQVLPSALALAQQLELSGERFLRACAIGYEITARIGSACDMRMSIHPHGTYGVVGGAVATGLLLGMGPEAMRALISLAAASPMAGNRQGMKEGSTLRNWYASHSAIMGQTAVRLIQSGFSAPLDGVAATCGDVLFDNFRPEQVVAGLGSRWLLQDGYIKLYGCGRPIHAAIDALRDALRPLGTSNDWPQVESIEKIEICGFGFVAFLNRRDIGNAFATRFSTPWAVASVLVNRSHGLECFSESALANASIHALLERIELREEPAYSQQFPSRQICDLRIHLRGGKLLTGRCEVIRGEPANPADASDYADKFFDMAQRAWSVERATELHRRLLAIDQEPDLRLLDLSKD